MRVFCVVCQQFRPFCFSFAKTLFFAALITRRRQFDAAAVLVYIHAVLVPKRERHLHQIMSSKPTASIV